MVANFKLTKNVILFLNGGIDMRKKSFIKIMISLCMIIMLVGPFKTSAKSNRSGFGDDSISLIGMCPYCPVSSFTVLECNNEKKSDGSGKCYNKSSCTIKYYISTYRGYICPQCKVRQYDPIISGGWHECYEVHSICNNVKPCKGGQWY